MSNRPFPLPRMKRGKLFILSAPSGTGKTTIAEMVLKNLSHFQRAVTTTTRPERPGEKHGIDYHFVSTDLFCAMKERGDFLESIEQYGHLYGTTKKDVEDLLSQGIHVLLVIDTQGAKTIARFMSDAVLIFLKPPSLEELARRLRGRGSEDEDSLLKRLQKAEDELLDETFFHYSVINDEIEKVYTVVSSIIIAECHRTRGM